MLRASRDDCASRDGGQQGSGNTHHAPRNRHGRHGVGYGSCADSKRRSDAPLRCPPSDNDIDPQAPSQPSPKGKECTTTSSNTTRMNYSPLGRAGDRLSINSCFCTANGGLFFTANGRFFYRRGGCRHAVHDGGDGGDGKEENSFSDCRHRHPRQGEADSHSHGFLYLLHPLIDAINSG